MMRKTFERFTQLLQHRLKRRISTTEDSVRYTFFHATALHPSKVVLEEFHSRKKQERKRIDAILRLPADCSVAIEFKFHRALRAGGHRPRPHQAGALIADVGRLHRYKPAEGRCAGKYLVYLTDGEMAKYIRNPRNGLNQLLDQSPTGFKITTGFFQSKSATFSRQAGKPFAARLQCSWAATLPHSYQLWIWRVY